MADLETPEGDSINSKCGGYYWQRKLIFQVQKYRILYDHYHTDFGNMQKKNECWLKIAKHLKSDVDVCRKEWFEIRYSYQRYVRRLRKFFYGGYNPKKLRPIMKFETELLFLYRFIGDSASYPLSFDLDKSDEEKVELETVNAKSTDDKNEVDDDLILIEEPVEVIVIDEDEENEENETDFLITKDIRNLIECIKNRQELYDMENPKYNDYKRKGLLWKSIANQMSERATKLIKLWIIIQARYEWEISHGADVQGKPSQLQNLMEFLKPHILKNQKTIYKQSYYLKKSWEAPLERFHESYTLLKTLRNIPRIIAVTELEMNNHNKTEEFLALWNKIPKLMNMPEVTAGQCEVLWLIMRSFYCELSKMRGQSYQLSDRWYFECYIYNLYKSAQLTLSNESIAFNINPTNPPKFNYNSNKRSLQEKEEPGGKKIKLSVENEIPSTSLPTTCTIKLANPIKVVSAPKLADYVTGDSSIKPHKIVTTVDIKDNQQPPISATPSKGIITQPNLISRKLFARGTLTQTGALRVKKILVTNAQKSTLVPTSLSRLISATAPSARSFTTTAVTTKVCTSTILTSTAITSTALTAAAPITTAITSIARTISPSTAAPFSTTAFVTTVRTTTNCTATATGGAARTTIFPINRASTITAPITRTFNITAPITTAFAGIARTTTPSTAASFITTGFFTTAPTTTNCIDTAPIGAARKTIAPINRTSTITAPITRTLNITAPITTAFAGIARTTTSTTAAPFITTGFFTTAPTATAPIGADRAIIAPINGASTITAPTTRTFSITAPITRVPTITAPITTAPTITALITRPHTITAPLTGAATITAPISRAPTTTAAINTAPTATNPATNRIQNANLVMKVKLVKKTSPQKPTTSAQMRNNTIQIANATNPLSNPNTKSMQVKQRAIASVSKYALPRICGVTTLLNPNEILIELIATRKGNILLVRGPPLAEQYSLSTNQIIAFVREVMAIPQIHTNRYKQPGLITSYWTHVAKKFNLPTHICRACWNFFLQNFNQLPKLAPMYELMKPFCTTLNVWRSSETLFIEFHQRAVNNGWLKLRRLPEVMDYISTYPILYKDINKESKERNSQNSMECCCAWRTIRLRFQEIINIIEIWEAFKEIFLKYMDHLEVGIVNRWPSNWWQTFAKMKFLLEVRYSNMEPMYYIVRNKIMEEIERCALNDMENRYGGLKQAVANEIKKRKDEIVATDTQRLTEESNSSTQLSATKVMVNTDQQAEIEIGPLLTVILKRTVIYNKLVHPIDKFEAWKEVAKEFNIEVTDCLLAFHKAVEKYRNYKLHDAANTCHLNQMYYSKFDQLLRLAKSITRTNIATVSEKNPTTANEVINSNRNDAIHSECFNGDINMTKSSSYLVIKNWINALKYIHNDATSQQLCTKLKTILNKYLEDV